MELPVEVGLPVRGVGLPVEVVLLVEGWVFQLAGLPHYQVLKGGTSFFEYLQGGISCFEALWVSISL